MMTHAMRCSAAALLVVLNGSAAAAQAPDRSQRPQTGPLRELRLPELQQFTLPNGLRVLLMEKHDLPLVQLNLIVHAGSVDDPADRIGLASLTADMLDEGAAGRSALALADTFELLGARFGVSGGQHASSATLRVPVARLPQALAVLGDVVLRPDFPAAELERLRKERLTALLRAHDQPGAIAGALSATTLFGRAHPYGRIADQAALRATTTDDLRAFHGAHWSAARATLIVVGDVTAAGIRPLIEGTFGAWATGAAAARTPVAAAPQVRGRTIYLVDKPGAAQSVIQLGRIGVERATADYFPLDVMNTILGGYFTSRLNQNLREQHGYTYGASSSFAFRPAPGPWIASAAVQTNATGPAVREFFNELEGMHRPIPEDELERAKSFIASQFAPQFQSVAEIASMLAELVLYDLPATYFNDYTRRVLAVTKADAERVARQYIDPANTAVFVVGDRAAVEPQLRELGIGEVRVLAKEDVLGPIPTLQ